MTDHDDRRTESGERLLQGLDCRQIEMIGRLVKEQDVGLRRQYAGERRAPCLPTGQALRFLFAGEAEAFKDEARAILIVALAHLRFDEGKCRRRPSEIRLLGQVTDRRPGLEEAGPAVWLDQAGGDLEKR